MLPRLVPMVVAASMTSVVPVIPVTAVIIVIVVAAAPLISVKVSAIIGAEMSTISATRELTAIAMAWIEAIIDIAVEASWAAVPGARSEENAIVKPLRAVIAVRSTVVRGVIEIAVRTDRRWTDVDAKIQRHLGFCRRSGGKSKPNDNSEECKIFQCAHCFTSFV